MQPSNVTRLVAHLRGEVPDQIRLKAEQVKEILARCQGCHQREFADWKSGPHGTTFGKIFLDAKHNAKRQPMDDCLRCHGMYFEGGIRDLVSPVNTSGQWRLLEPSMTNEPAIPCLACHSIHRDGHPLAAGQRRPTVAPSLAMFDRRTWESAAAPLLPIPAMREGARSVKMSPDKRQGLCYQCHAPTAGAQVWSGDDRTSVGVHEGLSCLACHQKHGQDTRASCATCHPRLSNCGLDVEKMDTTFVSPNSRHNVHTVKCADCHPKGVPQRIVAKKL
jgi:hypothetical protein